MVAQEPAETKKSITEVFTESGISIGTPWRLFIFSILMFLFSLLVFFGLKIGYKNYLLSESQKLDQKMIELSNSISEEDQQRFISIYSQIINLRDVLNKHLFTSNIFPFLEKNTLSDVFYKSAKFSSYDRTLILEGEARNLRALAAQLTQLEKAKEVERVVLTGMSFNPKGNSSFSLSIVFKGDYFYKPL